MYEALSEKVAWLFIQFFVFFALIKAISAMVLSLVSSLKTMMELALYGYPIALTVAHQLFCRPVASSRNVTDMSAASDCRYRSDVHEVSPTLCTPPRRSIY